MLWAEHAALDINEKVRAAGNQLDMPLALSDESQYLTHAFRHVHDASGLDHVFFLSSACTLDNHSCSSLKGFFNILFSLSHYRFQVFRAPMEVTSISSFS
jgi:hypothetical protein